MTPPFPDYEPPTPEPSQPTKVLAYVMLVIIAAAAALFGLAYHAWGHSAPTGWIFDPECCGNGDCMPVPATDIRETPSGYLIVPTKELIPYQSPKVRISPDGMPYRCSVQGKVTGATYCIYVARGAS